MRGESFRDGWCATKRERRGREGRKRAAREFAKLVKSEVKSLRNVRPPVKNPGKRQIALLLAVESLTTFIRCGQLTQLFST